MDSENSDQSLHLPQEIIGEILSRLPVKSLLRFKCVSKPWRRLIGSDRFIKLQLQKSRDDTSLAHWRVIFSYREGGVKQSSKRSYLDEPSIDPSPIEDPTNYDHPISGTVVGSINGVLCIRKKPGCFSLYNPSTRIFNELPKIEKAIQIDGFGWDETSDAYKVFAVVLDSHDNRIGQLYSSKINSWKTVADGCLYNSNSIGKFVGGRIYWLTNNRLHIESFDLKSEEFEILELPFKPEVGVRMWLSGSMMGCIGVTVDSTGTSLTDVWVMKKYGVKESWVKKVGRLPQRKITDHCGTHSYIESLVLPIQEQNQKNLWRGSGNKTKIWKFIKKLKRNTIYTCYSPSS